MNQPLTPAVLTNLARADLLAGTLRSLAGAGLAGIRLHVDLCGQGHGRAYLDALHALAEAGRAADPAGWVLLCEDDIAVPRGLGEYLTTVCERLDAHRRRLGFATLYCSLGYRDWVAAHPVAHLPQFGRLIPNDCYAGTQCILFPIESLAALLPAMRRCRAEAPAWNGDRLLGRAAELAGLEAWCHRPSLVDHRGRHFSTLASRADNLAMTAADYVGDEWEGGSWEMGVGEDARAEALPSLPSSQLRSPTPNSQLPTPMIFRLIREATSPARSGPFQGQYVLQRALRRYGPAWLRVGGELAEGEVPWFWCWLDAPAACRCAAEGRPFILGPNVLFHDSRRPGQFAYERLLCNAPSCRLLFTESAWYRELIAAHLGPRNRAPIALWPYPVAKEAGSWELGDGSWKLGAGVPRERLPQLPSPNSQLLVYAKRGFSPDLPARLAAQYPGSTVLRYGHFRREELLAAAGRAEVCVYLSDDDRGPLALAEILQCGCPAVGVPRGAPWIEHGVNGAVVPALEREPIVRGIAVARQANRAAVAAAARRRFHPKTVAAQIAEALMNVER